MVEETSFRLSSLTMDNPNGPSRTNVVVLYEDMVTRSWAAQLWERVAQLVGGNAVRSAWWNIDELSDPAILQQAVSATLSADAIMVSIHATGEPSPDFRSWIDAWVCRRGQREGTLIAVIGVSGRTGAPSDYVQQFLRSAARHGQLDFVLHECVGETAFVSPYAEKAKGRT